MKLKQFIGISDIVIEDLYTNIFVVEQLFLDNKNNIVYAGYKLSTESGQTKFVPYEKSITIPKGYKIKWNTTLTWYIW